MVITSVTITHLRSHGHTTIDCAPDVTILHGPNGSGKTSVLEAISLCSMGRTFVPVPDYSLIQRGADHAIAAVTALTDHDVPYRVAVELRPGVRKRIHTTHASSASVRELIGELPSVALSPDHKLVTLGGPAERRAFVDAVMAQTSRVITDVLFEHRRLLKQRNAVLSDDAGASRDALRTWTQPYIAVSADVVRRRARFLEALTPLVQEEYHAVAGDRESITITYQPNHLRLEEDRLEEQFQQAADRLEPGEWARGTTLFGPHKDEIELLINERSVRETASQGQHKSLLVALKIAECRLLEQLRRERPIVLLDDVFAELDRRRSGRVLDRIRDLKMQCLITTTEEDRFQWVAETPGCTMIQVEQGAVVRQEAA